MFKEAGCSVDMHCARYWTSQ